HTEPVVWVSFRGRVPSPPVYLAQKHSAALARGNLKVLQFDTSDMDDTGRLAAVSELISETGASRAVIWQADQLADANEKQLYGQLTSLLTTQCSVSLAVGTLPGLGQTIEFAPPSLCALADGILVTQLTLSDHFRASSLTVVKPVPAEMDKPGSPIWYQLSENGFFTSGHKPSDASGNGSDTLLSPPYFNLGKKQTYTFLPEISYHSREQ